MSRPAATELVPCNLCGADDGDVVGERDRDGHPTRTVLCRRCGLVWTNPRPPVAEIDRYYEREYRADYSGMREPGLRKLLRGMRGAADRRLLLRETLGLHAGDPAPGVVRVVDAGCGAGELVYLLRRDGFDASGVEPGREFAEFARQVLRIPVQTAQVADARVDAGSQDAVTLFHCLEHVADPRAVLAVVRGWLRPGGITIVEVPNIASNVQAPAHRFHFAHLYHFTGTTLAALGRAAGLEPVRTSYSPDGGNVIGIFRAVATEAGGERGATVGDLAASGAELRQRLAGHTTLGHYLTARPYRRALGRLRQRRDEDRLLASLRSVDDMLRWVDRDIIGTPERLS